MQVSATDLGFIVAREKPYHENIEWFAAHRDFFFSSDPMIITGNNRATFAQLPAALRDVMVYNSLNHISTLLGYIRKDNYLTDHGTVKLAGDVRKYRNLLRILLPANKSLVCLPRTSVLHGTETEIDFRRLSLFQNPSDWTTHLFNRYDLYDEVERRALPVEARGNFVPGGVDSDSDSDDEDSHRTAPVTKEDSEGPSLSSGPLHFSSPDADVRNALEGTMEGVLEEHVQSPRTTVDRQARVEADRLAAQRDRSRSS